MSQGAYLEFANRAFDKVDVTVDFSNKKDWEHGVYPQWENPVLTKKRYLSSTQLEMASGKVHGHFRVTITIDGKSENFGSKEFDLNDATNGTRNWTYYYSDGINDCVILVTYGRGLDTLGGEKMKNKRGCYRFEMFRASKRRIAVMTDYHYGCAENGNTGNQLNVVNEINSLRNRPEFLVMTGDLLHNPTKSKDNDIWKNFIDPLELKNIPVADGFGNHDLWTGVGAKDVKKEIKKRNDMRRKEWNAFEYCDKYNSDNAENKGYHYAWRVRLQKRMSNGELKQKSVECIMLNNVPGSDNVKDAVDTSGSHKKGTYCYDSLGFLDVYLASLGMLSSCNDRIVLLFFHINYESERLETSDDFYRWWPKDARYQLNYLINNRYKCPTHAFFGHIHGSIMAKEELHFSPQDASGLKGYRCAASKANRYLNVIDLELVEENGECKLRMTTKYGKTADLTVDDGGLGKFETKDF